MMMGMIMVIVIVLQPSWDFLAFFLQPSCDCLTFYMQPPCDRRPQECLVGSRKIAS